MASVAPPGGPLFVAGNSRALGCLRRALASRLGWFVSHLPVEGDGCVEWVARARVPAVWLSPWAVEHASEVSAKVAGACFLVVDDEGERLEVQTSPCRCLHLSARGVAADPAGAVARVLAFVAGEPVPVDA